jgi:hypothetical protein
MIEGKMTYDQWWDIRFRPNQALWRGDDLPFQVQLFHPGLYFDRTVVVNELAYTYTLTWYLDDPSLPRGGIGWQRGPSLRPAPLQESRHRRLAAELSNQARDAGTHGAESLPRAGGERAHRDPVFRVAAMSDA